MGIKDQFQEKAKRLAEQAEAEAEARGSQDEAPERSSQVEQDAKAQAQRARDAFDDNFDK
ncbi:hypothetical protein [Streptomyces sp. NPDC051183]|uniref:hypothetical protein n=1 Tax=unclassified Streptomyces TaxID=2593676 RepID=UPI0034235F97